MKNMKAAAAKIMALLVFLLAFTSCGLRQEGDRAAVREPGNSTVAPETAPEKEDLEAGRFQVSVEKIDQYEGVEITDWLDEQTPKGKS